MFFGILVWHIKFEKRKAHNELNKEIIFIAWHPRRWLNFCLTEDEKIVLLSNAFNASVVCNMEVLEQNGIKNYA